MSDVYYRKEFDPIESRPDNEQIEEIDSQLHEGTITEEDVVSLGLPSSVYDFLTKFNYERDVHYSLYGVLIDDVSTFRSYYGDKCCQFTSCACTHQII